MRDISFKMRRFCLKIPGENPIEADAVLTLRDEVTKALCGIAWYAAFDDHNEKGVIQEIPYMLIDRECPMSLQDFLSCAQNDGAPPPKGYQ